MNLAEQAFHDLFPEKEIPQCTIKYSAAFRGYNANVKYAYDHSRIHFRLSKEWKSVSDDIAIGLLQSLMVKVFKVKKRTVQMELYEKFLKNLSTYSKVEKSDPLLEQSFHRVIQEYFHNFMDKPNLVWGSDSFRKLGSYEYATDTIVISTLFKQETELLDYIMYHELLHKKLKFESKNGRQVHHSPEFKAMERKFKNKNIEKDLDTFLRKQKFKSLFRFW
ncbi:hypothetical protein C4573_03385 [Candidatus Woesearchaeota archaeon]|nr:MAG: hypothetical protein C4573_03385 [Candidatus Woesearchaeota archaeon]